MSQNKLVSVTINAYNSENFIAETLNSICSQSYKNLQIIVIDDASTDNTANIIKNFGDPRIELYTLEKNGHISNANNESYLKVRGDYMLHIDADDVMCPGLIEKSIDYLEQHPECGATFCRLSTIDQDGNPVINEYIENVFKVTAKTQADFVRLFFDSLNHLSHTGVTMRKSVIDDIGFHDLSLCYLHDFDYWTRLILKYPIYVFDECLAKYRMNTIGAHNSYLDEQKMIAHNTEFARIIYRMIDNCPDELFIEAFSDRFILKGEHTHKELNLEKAFLLQDGLGAVQLFDNKILSILMLSKLFQDKEYVELARDKFNFTVRDFYKLQTTAAFYNKTDMDRLKGEILNLNDTVNCLQAHIDGLQEHISAVESTLDVVKADASKKEQDINYYIDLVHHKQAEIDSLNGLLTHKQRLLNRTLEYNVGKFFKKIFKMLRRVKSYFFIRDNKGKKYKKSVMLYGYYGINLGDDLFFEKLVSRYPDTMFLVYSTYFCKEYCEFFERFDNVKIYTTEDSVVQKINKIGKFFGVSDFFELLLLWRSKGTVHVGGSIYQEIGDYKLDYKIRARRKRPGKPFYSISCNFGAYKTEKFKKMWTKKFKSFKDICFRDKQSYELFKQMKNVRYAPDLLFSYKVPTDVEEVAGSVAISVFNPFAPHRNIPEQKSNDYLETLAKTVCDLVNDGRKVTLLGFCAFEGDGVFLHDLLCRLPDGMREKINAINYTFDTKDQILNAISASEYVIGTRLHSVILGLIGGKKVLPIAYNQKINCILKDINYNQPVIPFEQMADYKEAGLAVMLQDLSPFDVTDCSNADDLQFKMLDKFLK